MKTEEVLTLKVGDRVRVTTRHNEDTDLGQVGTVLENHMTPWIRFDEPTRLNITEYKYKPDGWEDGYMDCIPHFDLELLPSG